MPPVLACLVCARPLDSLLTSGLQAGVVVMAVVAVAVIALLARGAVGLLRDDALTAESAEDALALTGRAPGVDASAAPRGQP